MLINALLLKKKTMLYCIFSTKLLRYNVSLYTPDTQRISLLQSVCGCMWGGGGVAYLRKYGIFYTRGGSYALNLKYCVEDIKTPINLGDHSFSTYEGGGGKYFAHFPMYAIQKFS